MEKTIARFQASTDEDLRWQLQFNGLDLSGRALGVYVRERGSNALKVKLTIGSGLTLIGTSNLNARVARSAMLGWARTEYETDVVDETGGNATTIVAVRVDYNEPGKLPYGVRGNQATITWANNEAVVTAIGGVGPPGPANTLTVPPDGVTTVAPDQPAEATITGDAPNQELRFKIPRGVKGDGGDQGWAPVFGLATDGARRVLVLVSWVGGLGTPPPVLSGGLIQYVGPTGFTTDIAGAVDVRGLQGVTGEKGWAPVLSLTVDVARRVLALADWVGGAGAKPPIISGGQVQYIGPTGLTTVLADAIDIRGAAGGALGSGDFATNAEAAAGTVADKVMSPATTKHHVDQRIGTTIGKLVAVVDDGSGNPRLPAIDGSQLTNMRDQLAKLTDVDLATAPPAAGDGLVFDGVDNKWKPGPAGGGMFKGDNGTVGSRKGDIFRISEQQLDTDTTIDAGENAYAPGPLAIASGVTLTVAAGGNLVIL